MTSISPALATRLGAVLFFFSLATACDSSSATTDAGPLADGSLAAPPTVLSSTPASDASGVPLNANASATFSEPMNPGSLGAATFTVTMGDPAVTVPGTVVYSGTTAVFWPSAHFGSDTLYTATITTGATSAAGLGLEADHVWRFTTGNTTAPGLPVNLGRAGAFVILAKSGVSTVPTSAVTGDVGLSPAAATFITGFSLTADPTNVFSTAQQVTGSLFAADYADPTPANLTAAVGDMALAFTDAAGRAPDVTELGMGNIGGMTLAPGVYKWSTALLIPTDITLMGSATDVWIFQVAQDLTLSSGVRVNLAGNARPSNVFWQVAGLVDLGTTAHCEGNVLTQTSVTLRTGASINGRLLAQTSVDIDGATVVQPAD